MSQQIEINAALREDKGKGASRRLRRLTNKVPGIIYGGDTSPQPLTLNADELTKAMQQEAFYSQILSVVVDGTGQQAVVRDLQRHPASDKVLHVDFLRIRADKPIQVHVPLHFINEENCVGVRQGGGNLGHNLIEVEISCLPADLPEFIEVDVENLELGHSLHLSDLVLPQGLTIVALTYGEERDIPVVSVHQPRGAAEEEGELDAEAAGEEGEEAVGDAETSEDSTASGDDAGEAPSDD
ncbi:MAG: 50S ribosomal protein L25/general stress protein Ctc [Gammaproteobacteria bacterium]|nr:50S ribosomal protein L25/general stress protein Ctc [Gammaproteobacteria bacterium]